MGMTRREGQSLADAWIFFAPLSVSPEAGALPPWPLPIAPKYSGEEDGTAEQGRPGPLSRQSQNLPTEKNNVSPK